MKNLKKISAILLAMIMLLSSLSAMAAAPQGLITNVKSFQSGVNIKGELDAAYAGKTVSILLVNVDADMSDLSFDDVAYIDDCKVDNYGKYSLTFTCRDGFEPANCKVYARIGNEDVTSSVVNAVSEENALELIDYTVDISQDLTVSTATVEVANEFNITDSALIEYTPVLAFFDDSERLIEVKVGETNNPKVQTIIPAGTRTTKAFVWKSIETPIPLCVPDVETKKDNLNILIIGNSFSVDGTYYLEKLAKAEGIDMNVAVIQHGGSRLSTVWEYREQDPDGNPYFSFQYIDGSSTGGVDLDYAFEQGVAWDYVLIQEWRPDAGTYEAAWEPYVTNLAKYIKEKCPNAEVGLQMTWAFELGKQMNGYFDGALTDDPAIKGIGQKEMWANCYNFNKRAAKEIGEFQWKEGTTVSFGGVPVTIVPSGYAIQYARSVEVDGVKKFDTVWDGGKYDDAARAFDALPDGSTLIADADDLISDADKAAGKIRLHRDGFHMSQAGRYLIGCVWFETFTGKSPVGNSYIPTATKFDSDVSGATYRTSKSGTQWVSYDAMDAETATLIQNIAHEAVAKYNKGDIIE